MNLPAAFKGAKDLVSIGHFICLKNVPWVLKHINNQSKYNSLLKHINKQCKWLRNDNLDSGKFTKYVEEMPVGKK